MSLRFCYQDNRKLILLLGLCPPAQLPQEGELTAGPGAPLGETLTSGNLFCKMEVIVAFMFGGWKAPQSALGLWGLPSVSPLLVLPRLQCLHAASLQAPQPSSHRHGPGSRTGLRLAPGRFSLCRTQRLLQGAHGPGGGGGGRDSLSAGEATDEGSAGEATCLSRAEAEPSSAVLWKRYKGIWAGVGGKVLGGGWEAGREGGRECQEEECGYLLGPSRAC